VQLVSSDRRVIFNRKLLRAHRALMLLRVRDADHASAARWAFAPMFAHPNERPIKRRHDSEQDERHAENDTPYSEAQHYA